jgi:hypothetical protein
MTLPSAAQSLAAASVKSPKTILGFFAAVIAILFAGATVVVGILARDPILHHLIVPILVYSGILIVVVLGGVFFTAWKDPTILMLGQVTGEVFIQHKKLILGDSFSGEFTEEVVLQNPDMAPILATLGPPHQDQGSEP